MPRLDGLAVLAAMRKAELTAAVLVLTSSADDQHLVQAIKAGALSYLPKTAGVDQVVEAVRAAARGESVLHPAATARLLRELRHASADPLSLLTPRETDVLKGLAQGRSNREIARALSISPAFILLDEPFSGIDPIAVLDLQKIISDLKASGIGVLITDHNVRETLSVTDRAYIINEGRIMFQGSPEQLGGNAEVRRVYLGESFSLV